MKSIAVMQPYLFPYLGYYQLAHHVDEFVFFDDVNYIKKGYINRNSIILDGAPYRFTLPVLSISQNRFINDHYFTDEAEDLISLIERAYRCAPFFDQVYPIICDTLRNQDRSVTVVTGRSIETIFSYLGIHKHFSLSSTLSKSSDAKGEQKIIEICQAKNASRYTNAIGGKQLYNGEVFAAKGIDLEFLKMRSIEYSHAATTFIPNLSIIDVLMHCSKERVCALLELYDIERHQTETAEI